MKELLRGFTDKAAEGITLRSHCYIAQAELEPFQLDMIRAYAMHYPKKGHSWKRKTVPELMFLVEEAYAELLNTPVEENGYSQLVDLANLCALLGMKTQNQYPFSPFFPKFPGTKKSES